MRKLRLPVLVLLLLLCAAPAPYASGGPSAEPERVSLRSGGLTLTGLLWRPAGQAAVPAVLLVHGSGRSPEELARLGPYETLAYKLGPVFAQHGYALFYLFRRGVGLSAGQGDGAPELMARAAAKDAAARNAVQLQLLEGADLEEERAGLAYLRARKDVDPTRLAIVAHSFGGSLALLLAEREPDVRAVVAFSAAGYSWERSPELRAKLLEAVGQTAAPVFFIHAQNDYSLQPGIALDARRAQLGRPHLLKIYPPNGRTPEEGHDFLYSGVARWEPDVFDFLDRQLGRP